MNPFVAMLLLLGFPPGLRPLRARHESNRHQRRRFRTPDHFQAADQAQVTFITDSDEVPYFGEAWPFSSDAMCNEGRVLFGFLFRRAFMPHEIVGPNLSD
jgi:hypothetical protein